LYEAWILIKILSNYPLYPCAIPSLLPILPDNPKLRSPVLLVFRFGAGRCIAAWVNRFRFTVPPGHKAFPGDSVLDEPLHYPVGTAL
jgi:hypothetical protein